MLLLCPHCKLYFSCEKSEINCGIFRHGARKDSGIALPPHCTEAEVEALRKAGNLLGCGMPFAVLERDGKYKAHKCSWGLNQAKDLIVELASKTDTEQKAPPPPTRE